MAQNIPFTPWQPFDDLPTTARTVRTVSESSGVKENKHGNSTIVRTWKSSKHDTTLMGRTLNVLPNKETRRRQAPDMSVQGLQECLADGQQPLGTALVQPVYKFNGVDGYELYAYTTVYYLNGTWKPWFVCKPDKEDITFMTRGLNKWGTPYDLQAAPELPAETMDKSEITELGRRAEDPIIFPAREVQAHLKDEHGRRLESQRLLMTTDETSGSKEILSCAANRDFNGARLIRGPVRRVADPIEDFETDDLQSDAASETTTKIAYEEPTKDLTPGLTLATVANEDPATTWDNYDSDATAKPVQTRKDLHRFDEDLDEPELSGRRLITEERTVELGSEAGSDSSAEEEEDYDDDSASNGIYDEHQEYSDDGESASEDDTPPYEFSYEELLPYRNTGWLHVAPYLRYPDYELESEIRNIRGRLPESSIRGLERQG
ncbi:hypothetical protein EYR36_009189 [Pleurotus pulmonarius]|nr:hypothetical protein EYR36_009189 [Pleurotus pulmonarius]KAF4592684.1 hypothetical protein EYR38_008383 [Pleurotus pulmonarius]